MRSTLLALTAVLALPLAASAATTPAPAKPAPKPAAAPACDRACLAGLMEHYVDALPTHSAKGLPIARDVKFTEQAARIPVGDGLWVGATEAPTTFKIILADPHQGPGLYLLGLLIVALYAPLYWWRAWQDRRRAASGRLVTTPAAAVTRNFRSIRSRPRAGAWHAFPAWVTRPEP